MKNKVIPPMQGTEETYITSKTEEPYVSSQKLQQVKDVLLLLHTIYENKKCKMKMEYQKIRNL